MGLVTRRQFIGATAAVAVVGQRLALPASGLTINPRSSWASNRPPLGPLDSEDVRFLLVHHSASRNGHTGAEAPGILRSFYDFHTSPEKGWNDIAYNFLIDADGGIWEGRFGSMSEAVVGDATGGNQGFSQLVCVIGDYNAAQPSQASLSSLVSLLAWLADRFGVSTSIGAEITFVSRGSNKWPAGESVTTQTITGHRTMSQTTCPGDNLYSYVAGSLAADVEAARGGSVPSTTQTTITATTTSAPSPTTSTTAGTTTSTTLTTTTLEETTTTFGNTTTGNPISTSAPTPTSLALAAEDTVVGATQSPLLWLSGALVAVGTGMVLWRYRRMGG